MTGIQRWRITGQPDPWMEPDDNGEVVDYADHVAAVKQAKRAALAAAVQRVEALEDGWDYEINERTVGRAAAIAAIKGGADA